MGVVSSNKSYTGSLQIANQAHAVVLAGGTLQPIEETRERLFPWLPSDNLHFFSCGHIIPRESILPIAVSSGPSGMSFDFSYSSRSLSKMVCRLPFLLPLRDILHNVVIVIYFFSNFQLM